MSKADIEPAIAKIVFERKKALDEAKAIIQRNDRDELLFLAIHQNHLMKVFKVHKGDELDNSTKAICSAAGDAYAYAIQLVYKFGNRQNGVSIDDYYRLIEISRFVNNGYEMEAILKYFPFQRFGERMQHFKINFADALEGDDSSRFVKYAARHEADSELRKARAMSVEMLIAELFPSSTDKEFLEVFGLSVEEVTHFFSALAREVTLKMTQALSGMRKMGPDEFDVMHMDSFRAARSVYTLKYDDFLNQFGSRKDAFGNFLIQQTLKQNEIDEFELRHFAIWRKHILPLDEEHFTFSPEITMFAPNIGLHYALLENKSTQASYQEKKGKQFQTRVESFIKSAGLRIIANNLDAKLGKRAIGDVDILAEDSDWYFNIECKGEILPLKVYFHDFEYIREVHLPYLRDKKGWDRKVVVREKWLNGKRKELGLSEIKPLYSLIVSDSPEILSHFSSVTCLSLHEFPLWYSRTKKQNRFITFDEFQEEILSTKMASVTDKSRGGIEEYLDVKFE